MVVAVALLAISVPVHASKMDDRIVSTAWKSYVFKTYLQADGVKIECLYAQTNEIDESLWYLKVAMTINGDVKNWVEKDADMKNVLDSPAFKKIMEGQKN